MKYLKEEVDQYNIDLYICERSSDLKKCDVLKNLWKPDIDYNFPVHIDKKNPKNERNFGCKCFVLFPYLWFSKLFEGAFCLCCVRFSTTYGVNTSELGHLYLQKSPRTLKNYKKKLYHYKLATSSMKRFLFTLVNKKKKVNYWLNKLDRKTIEKNSLTTKSLTKPILTMANQCLAFCRSDDSNIKGTIKEVFETSKYKGAKPRRFFKSS